MQLSDCFPIFPDFCQGDAMLGTPLGELRVFACYPSEFAFGFFWLVFHPVESSQGPSSEVITRLQSHGQVAGLDGDRDIRRYARRVGRANTRSNVDTMQRHIL